MHKTLWTSNPRLVCKPELLVPKTRRMSGLYDTYISTGIFDEMVTEDGCSAITKIHKYTLSNGTVEVDVIEYGATITAIRVPDKLGNMDDIVLGYDSIKGYMATENNPYFGATIGRVANRIAKGKFTLDQVTYVLSKNEGENTLHGGVVGFNRRVWKGCVERDVLIMRMMSPHLDQGFPGQLEVEARFTLTPDDQLMVTYSARTDQTTIVNMTNHTYFNLAGHKSGAEKLYEHNLMINAFNFTPVDDFNIPKGKLQDVVDSVLDFNKPKNVGEAIKSTGGNGYDINFCVNGPENETRLVACLEHPPSGRRMVVLSNQPGVQLYTANCTEVKEGKGKEGSSYSRHSALCLETQNYPDAVNQKNFPTCVLQPSLKYLHVVCYHFSTFDQSQEADEEVKMTERVSSSGVSQSEADKERKSEPEETVIARKCEKFNSPNDDSKGCQRSQFPDLRQGSRYIQQKFEYEPMTSINFTDLQAYSNKDFRSVLDECSTLLHQSRSKNNRFHFSEDITALNILTDTAIYPDWDLSKKLFVEKLNEATDTAEDDEAKGDKESDRTLSKIDKQSTLSKSASKKLINESGKKPKKK